MGAGAWRHQQLVDGYACVEGTFAVGRAQPYATIPFLIEAWAATREPSGEGRSARDLYPVEIVGCSINRSPAIIDLNSYRDGISRCASVTLGSEYIHMDVPRGAFDFAINISTPYIPILGDNKTPYLCAFRPQIKTAVEQAIKKAARANPPVLFSHTKDRRENSELEDKPERVFQRDAIFHVLPEAIERSGEGGYQFSLRSLYYRVRILTKAIIDAEPTYIYFSKVITDYEALHGEIDRLIRDTRGVFIAPHGGELTPLGTVTVAAYSRPAWSYSNILFLEKEDLVSALNQSGFLDRWDCFATSSKGFGTRAVRDLIDKIAAEGRDEPTKFFTVHDADASGSLIHQTLTKATRARGARLVPVIDLGLFPWTSLAEGLLREPVERTENKRPVADYIKERDQANRANGSPHSEPNWEEWLQDWRVELNAMTTAAFVEWMNAQFQKHGAAKVIPSTQLAIEEVAASITETLQQRMNKEVAEERAEELEELRQKLQVLEAEITEEAGRRADERFKKVKLPTGVEAVERISRWLKRNSHSHWRQSIGAVAAKFIP
jgi:hypothetical protein